MISTETLIEEALKDFDGVFPCIQSGCGNDGVIPEQDGEGDWQPAQCEFCYKIRFPVKEYFIKELSTIASKSAEVERLKLANFAVDHGYINSKEDVRLIWEELNETSK